MPSAPLSSELGARGLVLTWSSQRAHSLQDEADFTRKCEPVGKIHSAREGKVGRRRAEAGGVTSHGAKEALLRDARLSSLKQVTNIRATMSQVRT